uniref:Uncharacterized protein n=1 Tax=viral metagenome TaxID=1070528 RepID=A0A6C0JP43_9ZZZZ
MSGKQSDSQDSASDSEVDGRQSRASSMSVASNPKPLSTGFMPLLGKLAKRAAVHSQTLRDLQNLQGTKKLRALSGDPSATYEVGAGKTRRRKLKARKHKKKTLRRKLH